MTNQSTDYAELSRDQLHSLIDTYANQLIEFYLREENRTSLKELLYDSFYDIAKEKVADGEELSLDKLYK